MDSHLRGSWAGLDRSSKRALTINPLGFNGVPVPSNQPPGARGASRAKKEALQAQGTAPRIPHQCLVNSNASPSTPSQPRGSPLPHQRDVDAVGSSHGREGHVAADDGWQVLGGCKQGVRHAERGWGQRCLSPRLPPPPYKTPGCHSPTGENRSLLPCNAQPVKAAQLREVRGVPHPLPALEGGQVVKEAWRDPAGDGAGPEG